MPRDRKASIPTRVVKPKPPTTKSEADLLKDAKAAAIALLPTVADVFEETGYNPVRELINLAKNSDSPEYKEHIARLLMGYTYQKKREFEADGSTDNGGGSGSATFSLVLGR